LVNLPTLKADIEIEILGLEKKKMSLGWVVIGEDATLGGKGNWSHAATGPWGK